jgi:hypothetical protein
MRMASIRQYVSGYVLVYVSMYVLVYIHKYVSTYILPNARILSGSRGIACSRTSVLSRYDRHILIKTFSGLHPQTPNQSHAQSYAATSTDTSM